MLARGLRTSARRSISAIAVSKRPAAQVAQTSRTFVQPTNIDRATVIDAPHIPSEPFSPSPGTVSRTIFYHSDSGQLILCIYRFFKDSLGFGLESVKQNDRPIYLDMQVSLVETRVYFEVLIGSRIGHHSNGPSGAGCHVTLHDRAIW